MLEQYEKQYKESQLLKDKLSLKSYFVFNLLLGQAQPPDVSSDNTDNTAGVGVTQRCVSSRSPTPVMIISYYVGLRVRARV